MALISGSSKKIQVAPSTGTPSWQILNGNGNIGTTVLCPSCPSGIVLIYIDNQSIGKNVWFDDLFIGHYNSKVLEENHYYPFGLTLSKDGGGLPQGQPHKYNSKELEKSFDLEMYDYGARMYNSQIGRWNGIDEKSESYEEHSPYNYVGNNPVRRADIDGRDWWDKVVGAVNAAIDNNTGLNLRDNYTPTDAGDYNAAQDVVDALDIAGGFVEGMAGIKLMEASTAVTVGSGGAAIEVSGPGMALGTFLTLHGTAKTVYATQNFSSQKGRKGNASENTNSTNRNDGRKASDSGKNSKHGDNGRALNKSEKQIQEYKNKLENASGREKKKLEQKIKNVTRDAKEKA